MMKDIWFPVLLIIAVVIVIGAIGSCCVFFAKVWEFVNTPAKPTMVISDKKITIDGITATYEDYKTLLKLLANSNQNTIKNSNFTGEKSITLEELSKHLIVEPEFVIKNCEIWDIKSNE